jgi:putative DNA primase/helicase
MSQREPTVTEYDEYDEAFDALLRDNLGGDVVVIPQNWRDAAAVTNHAPIDSPLAGVDGRHYTDVGNAERLIEAHGEHLRYVPRWGRWIVYDGGRWRLDHADTLVSHLAASIGRALLDRIAEVYGNDRDTKAMLSWVRRSESAAGIAAALTVAATQPGVAIDHETLDADPWLLNVQNGTIDLRTGELRPHDPADMLTMQANVAFDANASASRFAGFVERVLPDPDVLGFVRRLLGLALLGDQPEHVLPIGLGGGANGKSTLTRIVAASLGEYAIVASRDVLLALKHDTHPTAKSDLFRRRFAHSGELPPNAKLDEAQVKELTGGDRIKARRMREDFWEFDPSHLLWLHANHRPMIEGTDDGIWRRVLLIPFDVQIPTDERDPRLADRIIGDEAPGVLNWMLAGLADYLTDGLRVPDIVRGATQRFRAESDTVAAFLAENGITFEPGRSISTGELLELHGDWFAANGPNEPEKGHYQRVVTVLKEHGARSRKTPSRGRFWEGVGAE